MIVLMSGVHPFLFKLNSDGQPTVVAGVPPDYFSPTGQLWGNPLYKWEAHQEQNYGWWLKRLSLLLSLVDLVRIDHFRGFESAWEIPHGETTAVRELGQKITGSKFFQVVVDQFDDLPFIAEDLGFITEEVIPAARSMEFTWYEKYYNLLLIVCSLIPIYPITINITQ